MLEEIHDYNSLKSTFDTEFRAVLAKHPQFKLFMFDIFIERSAYVVGGFLRDIANKKKPRDLDMIILLSHEEIVSKIQSHNLETNINRHKGIKIKLGGFEADIWSIENNWAFVNNVVKQNDNYLLESIANGCFYNYDSLVINVHTKNLNVKHYNEFVCSKKLDILQKKGAYKVLNPTIEANILRALYLDKIYGISFTANCRDYLTKRLNYLNDKYQNNTNSKKYSIN